jgi:hypothetical protein
MKKVNPNILFKKEEIWQRFITQLLLKPISLEQKLARLKRLEARLDKINIYQEEV